MAIVLVADNTTSIRESLSSVLEKVGHRIVAASSAAEVEKFIARHEIDVAIVDVQFDGDSGLDVTRHLRDTAPSVQVILMNDTPEVQSAIEAVRLGAFDYLAKPLREDQIVDIISRAASEKWLRDEFGAPFIGEQRFRVMFETHEAVMLLIEPDSGRIIDANLAATRFYGYPSDELRSMSIHDINCLSPEQVQAERLRADKREQNYFVFPHRLSSGEIRTVEVHSSPVELRSGHFLFSIIHDATARQQAENALRELEERYRVMIQQAGVGIGFWSPDGRVISMNDEAIRLLKTSKEQLIGKTPVELFGAEQGEIYAQRIAKQVRDGELCEYMDEVILPTGTRWFVSSYATVSDGAGNLQGVLIVAHDITERKQAEESLQEARDRELEAVRAAHVGLWDWDFATNTVRYSTEWARQLGYEEGEISDKFEEWRDRVHPDDLPSTLERVEQMIADAGSRYVAEFRLRHKDSSYRWILAQGTARCDQAGRAVRVLGSHIDITERKRMEEELIEHQENLEEKVRERTRELRIVIKGMTGRELRMAELKTEIAALKKRLSEYEE